MRSRRSVTETPIGSLAQLEVGDRLAGLAHHRLLARDRGQVGDRRLHGLGVAGGLPTPMFAPPCRDAAPPSRCGSRTCLQLGAHFLLVRILRRSNDCTLYRFPGSPVDPTCFLASPSRHTKPTFTFCPAYRAHWTGGSAFAFHEPPLGLRCVGRACAS